MNVATRYQRKKITLGDRENVVLRLIIINAVVFVLLNFVKVTFFLTNLSMADFTSQVMPWVELPANVHVLLSRPWTIFTYMFTHLGLMHILGNLLWLWWFGTIFQDMVGYRKVIPLYLYGGLAGALFFILAYNLFPVFSTVMPVAGALGASASIMALAIAATVVAPDYRLFPQLFGGIPLWLITGIYILIDLVSIPNGNAGGHIGHLGGALMGTFFALQLKRGRDIGEWMNVFVQKLNNLFDPDHRAQKRVVRKKAIKQQVPPYRKIGGVSENKVDEILDKISQSGYGSLSAEEKEILMRASRDDK